MSYERDEAMRQQEANMEMIRMRQPDVAAAIDKFGATANRIADERNALLKTNRQLMAALKPFVVAYEKAAEPIGDSDLYGEQPRSVSVTLGDCRTAAAILHHAEEDAK